MTRSRARLTRQVEEVRRTQRDNQTSERPQCSWTPERGGKEEEEIRRRDGVIA